MAEGAGDPGNRPMSESDRALEVIGGSGDFFPLADTVIMMERYVPFAPSSLEGWR